MKVRLSTYCIYSKLLSEYNNLYPEESVTFPEIIHRAVFDLLKHSNELGFEKAAYGKMKTINCLLEKGLYAQCLKLAEKLGCSYDKVINYALARFYTFFATDTKKRVISRSWNKSRVAIILTLLDVGITKDRGSFFLVSECPSCGHEDYAIASNGAGSCIACGEQTPLLDIVTDRKSGYAEAVNWTYEQIITNYQENLENVDVEINVKTEKTGRQKGFVNDVLLRDLMERSYPGSVYLEEMYGFAPEILEQLVRTRDDSASSYSESNEFINRVLFIIRDEKGNLVGVEGRSIYDDSKARRTVLLKNPSLKRICEDFMFSELHKKKFDKLMQKSISTAGYRKGQHLYLLDQFTDLQTRAAVKQVVVTEGAKDAIRVFSAVQNLPEIAVVGLLGSNLTDEHIFLLAKMFGDKAEIVLALDQDNAGFAKTEKAKTKLKSRKTRYVIYPSGYKDFGQIEDLQEVLQTIQQAVDYEEYFRTMIARGYEPEIKRSERKPEEKEDRGQRLRRKSIEKAAEIFQEKRRQKQLREQQPQMADAIPF